MTPGLLIATDVKIPVRLHGLTANMLGGLVTIVRVLNARGIECWVTSGLDGRHSTGSLHYVGNAVDIRTRNHPRGVWGDVVKALKAELGRDFDVVLEKDHLHVEYDPKVRHVH